MTKSVSGSQQLVCAVKGGFKAEALSLSFHLACQGDSGVGRPSYNQKFLGPPQSARTWLNHKVIGWCCKSSRCIPGRIRSNPRMRITDMRGVCAIAHKSGLPSRAVPLSFDSVLALRGASATSATVAHPLRYGILVSVDSTMMPPVICKPLTLGHGPSGVAACGVFQSACVGLWISQTYSTFPADLPRSPHFGIPKSVSQVWTSWCILPPSSSLAMLTALAAWFVFEIPPGHLVEEWQDLQTAVPVAA